jgi:hypothetical protein
MQEALSSILLVRKHYPPPPHTHTPTHQKNQFISMLFLLLLVHLHIPLKSLYVQQEHWIHVLHFFPALIFFYFPYSGIRSFPDSLVVYESQKISNKFDGYLFLLLASYYAIN